MTDIVVTLPRARGGLFHLWDKAEEPSYWTMRRKPKDFTEVDHVFICCEGVIHGFFEVSQFYLEDDRYYSYFGMWVIEFKDDSFIKIIPIAMKGFQGFRYRKFEYELSDY